MSDKPTPRTVVDILICNLLDENAQLSTTERKQIAKELAAAKAYPTEEAYLAVCAARTKWQERAEQAEQRLAEVSIKARQLLNELNVDGHVQQAGDELNAAIAQVEP